MAHCCDSCVEYFNSIVPQINVTCLKCNEKIELTNNGMIKCKNCVLEHACNETNNNNAKNDKEERPAINSDRVFHQMFSSTNLFHQLDRSTILNLTLTSKTIFKILHEYINNFWTFSLNDKKIPRFYQPKKVRMYPTVCKLLTHNGQKFKIRSVQRPITLIPSNITHLSFEGDFNQKFDNLSQNLAYLSLGDSFEHSVIHFTPSTSQPHPSRKQKQTSQLPSKITHLSFGFLFNSEVDHLPPNITHLKFSYCFNKSVDHLPSTITHLWFGASFNRQVNNLPVSLTHCVFGNDFNHCVPSLPPNLEILVFGWDFNQIVDTLPQKLSFVEFGHCFDRAVNRLPETLKHLILAEHFSHTLDSLPKSLEFLTIGEHFNKPIHSLPTSLTYLSFGQEWNHPIDNNNLLLLLPNLIKLEFGDSFNGFVDNYLPPNLITLIFGTEFDQSVDALPPNLEVLIFGAMFNHSVEKLPPKIKFLRFGMMFSQSIYNLPPNINEISFFEPSFKNLLRKQATFLIPPKNLTHLKILTYNNWAFNLFVLKLRESLKSSSKIRVTYRKMMLP